MRKDYLDKLDKHFLHDSMLTESRSGAHLAVVGFVFDQGVQFARVLPGALFTILQVGAEPGEALVTVVGLLGCWAPQMSYPTPALPPTSPFGPKQLLSRLSNESQQQTQQTGPQSSVHKANTCTHTPAPRPLPVRRDGESSPLRGLPWPQRLLRTGFWEPGKESVS